MPISRKKFSKKRIAKKLVRKNTRKYKKRTPRRKHRKSGKRNRFFGGVGEDGNCPICFEPLTSEATFTTNCQHIFHRRCIRDWCARPEGRGQICTCPLCRTQLNPSPNQTPNQNPNSVPTSRLYRVQLFRHVRNPETGETDRVPVSVQSLTPIDMMNLRYSFINRFDGALDVFNFTFYRNYQRSNSREEEGDPDGYIKVTGPTANSVHVIEGDMDIDSSIYVHYPPTNVDSVTITRL